MKTAVITDSSSGITQMQGQEAGIYVVPMPFMMEGENFYEDVNLTQEDFYRKLREGMAISTSQPSPGELCDLWDSLLKEYDNLVYIPLSSGLSTACHNASMLAGDYKGRVVIVDNQRISITQRQSVLEAKEMADKGISPLEIKERLEAGKLEASIYVTLDTLEYLKRGGRITPAAALLGTFLRIKPVLTIQGEKLDAFSKARTLKQAKSIMIEAIRQDMKERFSDTQGTQVHIAVAHTESEEAARELKWELMALFPGTGDIYVDHLSLNVACHIGPGALAIACTKKLDI